MRRKLVIALCWFALCGIAFVSGWIFRTRSVQSVRHKSSVTSSFAAEPHALPPDFGSTVYQDLAAIPFSELYDRLREARPELRAQWLEQLNHAPEGARKVAAVCAF